MWINESGGPNARSQPRLPLPWPGPKAIKVVPEVRVPSWLPPTTTIRFEPQGVGAEKATEEFRYVE